MLLIPAAAVVVVGVAFGLAGSGLLSGLRPVGNAPVTSLEWTTRPFVTGARVMDLTALGDRLIATGSLNNLPAAWYSDDGGETWTASTVDPVVRDQDLGLPGPPHALGQVAERDGLLMALDIYTTSVSSTASPDPVGWTSVWTSRDLGATWVSSDAILGTGGALMSSAGGFVSFGIGPNGLLGWTSADGMQWTHSALTGIDSDAHVIAGASSGSHLVVVGGVAAQKNVGASSTPAVWLSNNGIDWTEVQLSPDTLGVAFSAVVTDDGLQVVGITYTADPNAMQQPVLWTSTDGSDWSARKLPTVTRNPQAAGLGLAVNRWGSLVAVPHYERGTIAADMYFIPGGQSHEAAEQGLGRQVSALAALPDRFVLFSQCDTSGDCHSPTVSIGRAPSHSQPTPKPSTALDTRRDLVWVTKPFPDEAILRSITAVGERLIVTGSASGPAAWYSDDGGDAWTRATVESSAKLIDPSLGPITRLGDNLVSLGSAEGAVGDTTSGNDADRHGAIWMSADNGTTWNYLSHQEAPAAFTAIASGQSGLVAVGNRFDGTGAGVWRASDAKVWHETRERAAFDRATITSVVSNPDGFVAFGYRITNEPRPDSQWAAAWTSADGVDWKLWDTSNPSGPAGLGAITDATVVPDGSVMASGYGFDQPVIWHWRGGEWSVQGVTEARVGSTAIATGGLGTVFVAQNKTMDPTASRIWFVSDGASDEWPYADADIAVTDVAVTDDRVVGIGNCGATADCSQPMLVIGRPREAASKTPPPKPSPTATPPTHAVGPTAPSSVPGLVFVEPGGLGTVTSVASSSNGWVAVGTANGQPGIWHSFDGTAWQRVGSLPAIPNTPAGSPVTVHDVVATATGFVAVGSVSTAVDHSRPFAWFSADGASWTSAELPGSDGCGSVQALVKTRSSQLVAVGRTCGHSQAGSTAAIWLSDDGTSWRTASVADAVGGAIDDIAQTADGFVAAGSVREGSLNRPRIWESSDGEKWESTWTDTREGAMNSVTALDETVVAGGVLGQNTSQLLPGMWVRTSRDEWAVRDIAGDGQCCGVIESVAVAGSQLFALDQASNSDGTDRRTLLLTSRDAVAWQTAELANSFTGSALSVAPNGSLLALGSALSDGDVPAPAILVVPHPGSPTGLTRDKAVAAARQFAGVTQSTPVLSADQGPCGRFDPDPNLKASPPPADHLVWRVAFAPPGQPSQSVIIDYYSGALIEVGTALAN
jgi:hypothetical protein